MAGSRPSLSRVVSGGGSAAAGPGRPPANPAIPASVIPLRKLRLLNRLPRWVCIETSLLSIGHNETEYGDWLTLALARAIRAHN